MWRHHVPGRPPLSKYSWPKRRSSLDERRTTRNGHENLNMNPTGVGNIVQLSGNGIEARGSIRSELWDWASSVRNNGDPTQERTRKGLGRRRTMSRSRRRGGGGR